jgi:hypothetical protein
MAVDFDIYVSRGPFIQGGGRAIYQIGDGHCAVGCGIFAQLPGVFRGGQFFGERAQLLRAIGAETRDDSIEEQDGGNNGKQVGAKKTGPTEQTNPRSTEEQQEYPNKHEGDGRGVAPGDFENADALPRVDRSGVSSNAILGSRFHSLECAEIRIFIREADMYGGAPPRSFCRRFSHGPPPPEHRSTIEGLYDESTARSSMGRSARRPLGDSGQTARRP